MGVMIIVTACMWHAYQVPKTCLAYCQVSYTRLAWLYELRMPYSFALLALCERCLYGTCLYYIPGKPAVYVPAYLGTIALVLFCRIG